LGEYAIRQEWENPVRKQPYKYWQVILLCLPYPHAAWRVGNLGWSMSPELAEMRVLKHIQKRIENLESIEEWLEGTKDNLSSIGRLLKRRENVK
jgi:hypothetical protein